MIGCSKEKDRIHVWGAASAELLAVFWLASAGKVEPIMDGGVQAVLIGNSVRCLLLLEACVGETGEHIAVLLLASSSSAARLLVLAVAG